MPHKSHQPLQVDVPDFLTIDEIAERLNLSRMTIYRLVKSGQLPAYRFGGRSIRISRETFEGFVAARSPGAYDARQNRT